MRFALIAATTLAFTAADTNRGAAADTVAEIVTFRLVDGADPKAFAQAANGMTPFLTNMGGVLNRTLSVDETGLWTDHITWSSMAAAKSAASEVMNAPQAAPFMQMIDPETVEMRHAHIRFGLTPD